VTGKEVPQPDHTGRCGAPELEIRPLGGRIELEECARLMASSEPWLTLGRDVRASLEKLSGPEREVYVALSGGRILGFVVIIMEGPFVGYIQSIAVTPGMRGRGVGTGLMRFAEDRILSQTPNVFICVSSFNPRAERLYRRLGYQVIGELKDWIVAGHSEILLRKTAGPLYGFQPGRELVQAPG